MTSHRLILHAGMHKTGTTALQNILASHREVLLNYGIMYPDLRDLNGEPQESHLFFAHAIAGMAEFDINAFINTLRASNTAYTILISAEAICRHLDGGLENTPSIRGYWKANGPVDLYWSNREAYLVKLRDLLSGFNVLPVLTYRRQDKLAESLYSSFVASLGEKNEFEGFVSDRVHWFNFEKQIELFQRVFGTVQIIHYDPAHENIANHFLYEVFGIKVPGLTNPKIRASVDPRITLWMRKKNIEAGRDINVWRSRTYGFDKWINEKRVFSGCPKVGFWKSQEMRDDFLYHYDLCVADPVLPLVQLDNEVEDQISSLFREWEWAGRHNLLQSSKYFGKRVFSSLVRRLRKM